MLQLRKIFRKGKGEKKKGKCVLHGKDGDTSKYEHISILTISLKDRINALNCFDRCNVSNI